MDEQRRFPQESGLDGDVSETGTHQIEKTKDELIEQLAELWNAADETNFDPAAIDACLDALDAQDPVCTNFDAEASLAAFWASYAELSKDRRASQASPCRPRKRWMVRTSVAVAATALASLVLVQAGGFLENQIYPRDTGEQFHFGVDTPGGGETLEFTPDVENTSYSTLQEALDDYGIKTQLAPTWYPEGFALSEMQVRTYSESIKFYTSNKNGETYISVSISQYKTYQELETVEATEFEKNIVQADPYVKNGIDHYIMENNGRVKVSWINGSALGAISGSLTKEEAISMIDSIYEGK